MNYLTRQLTINSRLGNLEYKFWLQVIQSKLINLCSGLPNP